MNYFKNIDNPRIIWKALILSAMSHVPSSTTNGILLIHFFKTGGISTILKCKLATFWNISQISFGRKCVKILLSGILFLKQKIESPFTFFYKDNFFFFRKRENGKLGVLRCFFFFSSDWNFQLSHMFLMLVLIANTWNLLVHLLL